MISMEIQCSQCKKRAGVLHETCCHRILCDMCHLTCEVAQPDESTLRAANIPYIPPASLDNAYELTLAIEQASTKSAVQEVPVFGLQRWIDRARVGRKR